MQSNKWSSPQISTVRYDDHGCITKNHRWSGYDILMQHICFPWMFTFPLACIVCWWLLQCWLLAIGMRGVQLFAGNYIAFPYPIDTSCTWDVGSSPENGRQWRHMKAWSLSHVAKLQDMYDVFWCPRSAKGFFSQNTPLYPKKVCHHPHFLLSSIRIQFDNTDWLKHLQTVA